MSFTSCVVSGDGEPSRRNGYATSGNVAADARGVAQAADLGYGCRRRCGLQYTKRSKDALRTFS